MEDVYKAVELANDILFGDVVKFKDELRYKLGIVPPHFDEVIKVTASAEDGVLAFLKYEVDIQHLERVPPPMMYKPIEVLHIEFDRVKRNSDSFTSRTLINDSTNLSYLLVWSTLSRR